MLNSLARACVVVPLLCAYTCATADENLLKNPTFSEGHTGQMPKDWTEFPGGSGLKMTHEGLQINDKSSDKGLGAFQWAPAIPGALYTVNATFEGEGGLFIYLIFTSEIPNQAGGIKNVTLAEKRKWFKGGGEAGSFSATAPAGAKFVQVWIYSPTSGITNVVATDIDLTMMTAEQVAEANRTFFKLEGNDRTRKLSDWIIDSPQANGDEIHVVKKEATFTDKTGETDMSLARWIPVMPGQRFDADLTLKGEGGVSLYLNFYKDKPESGVAEPGSKISGKTRWVKVGQDKKVVAVAPADALWMQVQLLSPKTNKCDLQIEQLSISASKDDIAAQAVKNGLFDWMSFETGDFSECTNMEDDTRKIISKVNGPVREGDYSYECMLLQSEKRTEVVGANSPAYGLARFGWSIYVPENFDANTMFSIVTQWHDYGTGKKYPPDGGAPTHLYIANGNWRFKLRYQGEGDTTTASKQFTIGSIEDDRGKWTDWVLEINFQPPGKGGWMKLYKNDELVADYTGPTWYEGKTKGPYFKMGIYKGYRYWKGEEEGAHLLFDSFRMAIGEDSTYEQVAPSAHSPRPN